MHLVEAAWHRHGSAAGSGTRLRSMHCCTEQLSRLLAALSARRGPFTGQLLHSCWTTT